MEDPVEGTSTEHDEASTPRARRRWRGLAVVAAVVAGALIVAGIGLTASAHRTEQTASAGTLTVSDTVKIVQPFTVKWAASAAMSGAMSAGAGAAMQALLGAMGYKDATAQALENMQQDLDLIKGKLDGISGQIIALDKKTDTVLGSLSELTALEAYGQISAERTMIHDLWDTVFMRIVRAQVAHAHKDYSSETNTYGYSQSVTFYQNEFVDLYGKSFSSYSPAGSAIHKAVMGTSLLGNPLLRMYAQGLIGKRKYYTVEDSIRLHNLYAELAGEEAMAALMKAEYLHLRHSPIEAEGVLDAWKAAQDAEQAKVPPLLPEGVIVSIPGGLKETGIMWIAPRLLADNAPTTALGRAISWYLPSPVLEKNAATVATPVDAAPLEDYDSSFRWLPIVGGTFNLTDGNETGVTFQMPDSCGTGTVREAWNCGKIKFDNPSNYLVGHVFTPFADASRSSVDSMVKRAGTQGWRLPTDAEANALTAGLPGLAKDTLLRLVSAPPSEDPAVPYRTRNVQAAWKSAMATGFVWTSTTNSEVICRHQRFDHADTGQRVLIHHAIQLSASNATAGRHRPLDRIETQDWYFWKNAQGQGYGQLHVTLQCLVYIAERSQKVADQNRAGILLVRPLESVDGDDYMAQRL